MSDDKRPFYYKPTDKFNPRVVIRINGRVVKDNFNVTGKRCPVHGMGCVDNPCDRMRSST